MKLLTAFMLILATLVPAQAQQPGWIGVSVEDGKDQGAVVQNVETGSPAEKAGLKTGDILVEYNKTPVLGAVQLGRLVRETPVGRTVEVKFRRENREQTLQVTTSGLADATRDRIWRMFPNTQTFTPDLDLYRDRLNGLRLEVPRFRMTTSYTRAGIRVDEMTTQLREFFGVDGGAGVLVSSVEAESVAEKAGLKAGDVITAVDNRTVRTPVEFDREMRAGSTKLSLRIVREKRSQDIAIDRGPESRR